MSLSITSASSSTSAGTWYRLVSACGVRTYSAWVPSIVLPRIQPPVRQCEYMPRRHRSQIPHALMQEISTRSPGWNADTAGPTASTTPMPSCPRMRPGVTRRHVALHDVKVGAADRRGRDPDDGVARIAQDRSAACPPTHAGRGRGRPAPSSSRSRQRLPPPKPSSSFHSSAYSDPFSGLLPLRHLSGFSGQLNATNMPRNSALIQQSLATKHAARTLRRFSGTRRLSLTFSGGISISTHIAQVARGGRRHDGAMDHSRRERRVRQRGLSTERRHRDLSDHALLEHGGSCRRVGGRRPTEPVGRGSHRSSRCRARAAPPARCTARCRAAAWRRRSRRARACC